MANKKKVEVHHTVKASSVDANEYINQVYMSMPKEDKAEFDNIIDKIIEDSREQLKSELYHMAMGAPKTDPVPEEKPKRRRSKKATADEDVNPVAEPTEDLKANDDKSEKDK